MARLNPDGTLDLSFDPDADSIVHSIALQPDGKIVVGGYFAAIGGQPRNRIARLMGAPDWRMHSTQVRTTLFSPSRYKQMARS